MLPGEPYEITGGLGDFSTELVEDNPESKYPRARRKRQPPIEYSGHAGLEYKLAIVRHPDYDASRRIQILSSEDVYTLFADMKNDVQENFYTVALNSLNYVIGVAHIHRGTSKQCYAIATDILRPILALAAPSFIAIHNHPSSDATPSEEDIDVTMQLEISAAMLGIKLFDHVIIARYANASLRDMGYIDQYVAEASISHFFRERGKEVRGWIETGRKNKVRLR